MSAQCLSDNAANFREDKALVILIEVRDRRDMEPVQSEQIRRNSENRRLINELNVDNKEENGNMVPEENMIG